MCVNTKSMGKEEEKKEKIIWGISPDNWQKISIAVIGLITLLGGFAKITFFSNLMFACSLGAMFFVVVFYCMAIEKFEKENPLLEDAKPMKKETVRIAVIAYSLLVIFNIGFGFWITAIFWAVAGGFAIANFMRYTDAYNKQFGKSDKEESDGVEKDDITTEG